MLNALEARRAMKEAEASYVEAARARFGPAGETRESRERYEQKLASLVACYDQLTLLASRKA